MLVPAISKTVTITPGSKDQIPLSFLPKSGVRRGTRRVIDHLLIRVDYQVDTDGATSLTAADTASLLEYVRVYDWRNQDRRNLKGPHLRAIARRYYGFRAPEDGAAIAISQTNLTGSIYLVVPFGDPRIARRRWDTSIPVDHMTGIEIAAPAVASVLKTGTALTIDSLAYTVCAFTRDEADIESHILDEWKWADLGAAGGLGNFDLAVNGHSLAELHLFKPAAGATGGTALDAITTYSIPSLQINTVPYEFVRRALHLEHDYDQGATDDAFELLDLVTLWDRHYDSKWFESPWVAQNLNVQVNGLSAIANCHALVRTFKTKNEDDLLPEARRARGQGRLTMHTVKGTSQDKARYGVHADTGPMKARSA